MFIHILRDTRLINENYNQYDFCTSLQLDIPCLLYTSDAADDMQCVDLGGRRIIKKEN